MATLKQIHLIGIYSLYHTHKDCQMRLCAILFAFGPLLTRIANGQCNSSQNTSCPPKKTINPDDDNPLVVVTTITKTIVNVVQAINSLTVNAPMTTSTSTIWVTSSYISTELALSTITSTTTIVLPTTITTTLTKVFINDSVTTQITEGTTTVGTVATTSFRSLSTIFTSFEITTLYRQATEVVRITGYIDETTTVYSYRQFFTTRTIALSIGSTITSTATVSDILTTQSIWDTTNVIITRFVSRTRTATAITTLQVITYSTFTNVFYHAAVTTSVITLPFFFSLLFEGTFTLQTATETILIN